MIYVPGSSFLLTMCTPPFLSLIHAGINFGGRELLLRHDDVGHRHGEFRVGGAGPAADGNRETFHQRVLPAEGRQH